MATITQNIPLDFSKEGVQAVVSGVKRGESNVRELVFSFTNDGQEYTLAENDVILLRCVKPNLGVYVSEPEDITIDTDNNVATFVVPASLTLYAGEITAELEISTSQDETQDETQGKTVFSPAFCIIVSETTVSTQDTVLNTSDYPSLTAAIYAAQAAKANAIVSAELDRNGHLILTKENGSTLDVGDVRGIGIADVEINANGNLRVQYTSSSTWHTIGRVKGDTGAPGRDGQDGQDGAPGVGIRSIELVWYGGESEEHPDYGQYLLIAKTDGTSNYYGPVNGADGESGEPGADGRGISAVTINQTNGHLEIEYDDSSTEDAGMAKPVNTPTVFTDPTATPIRAGDMLAIDDVVFVAVVKNGALAWNLAIAKADLTPKQIQTVVRAGMASAIFKPHVDQIMIEYDGTLVPFDILGIDQDEQTDSSKTHSMTIAPSKALFSAPFDSPEALFYFADGLAAGTYHFTVTGTTAGELTKNKTFQFTINNAIPAGGQLTLDGGNANLISYASPTSTTKIETVSFVEGSGGTALGNVTNEVTTSTNTPDHARHGNNYYELSEIRQIINSSSASGSEWQPSSNFDRPPATRRDGLLHGFTAEFVSVLGAVGKAEIIPAAYGRQRVINSETVFLPSIKEVYGSTEYLADGLKTKSGTYSDSYQYYAQYAELASAGDGTDANRAKGSAWHLRSCQATQTERSYRTMQVAANGSISAGSCGTSAGIIPCFCII